MKKPRRIVIFTVKHRRGAEENYFPTFVPMSVNGKRLVCENDELIAVWDGNQSSKTHNSVEYASEKG